MLAGFDRSRDATRRDRADRSGSQRSDTEGIYKGEPEILDGGKPHDRCHCDGNDGQRDDGDQPGPGSDNNGRTKSTNTGQKRVGHQPLCIAGNGAKAIMYSAGMRHQATSS